MPAGDWNPRKDTFPGDSIKQMVDEFHKQGMLAQLWWLPLGVGETGRGNTIAASLQCRTWSRIIRIG